MTSSLPTPVALLGRPATYKRLAYVASALALGPAWLVLLVTGWSLGVGLLITLLGIPVLVGLSYAVRAAAGAERWLANGLLDAGLAPRPAPARDRGLVRGLRDWLADGASWREMAYLVLRFVGGLPLAVVVVSVIWTGFAALFAPTYYMFGDGIDLGFRHIDTLPEALAVTPVGALILLFVCAPLANAAGLASRAVARNLLGAGDGPAAPAPGGRTAPLAATGPLRRGAGAARGLLIHAGIVAVLVVGLIVIWALTTPGGYFWPAWPAIWFAVPLSIHAVTVALQPFGTGARARLRGLWLHAGIAAVINLYLISIWALSTPGGYFWPMWTILAFAIPVAAHAVVVAVARGDRQEMAQRIDTLTATRAGAVDAQAAELRRIERDLHDGAQARLVALAMDLGMARERMSQAPPETLALVEEAHEQAKRALSELRNLARGIHPAVLTDRGLAAAIETLAGHSRVPVHLDLAPGGRAPAAVEAAAYFVVAEALTNVNKHSRATTASIDLARRGGRLVLTVADDGAGAADPSGGGLAGLRHRVEALDGVLLVTSPPGGGTVVHVELPCGS